MLFAIDAARADHPQAPADLCRRNRIRHLGLFGSTLRDGLKPVNRVSVLASEQVLYAG